MSSSRVQWHVPTTRSSKVHILLRVSHTRMNRNSPSFNSDPSSKQKWIHQFSFEAFCKHLFYCTDQHAPKIKFTTKCVNGAFVKYRFILIDSRYLSMETISRREIQFRFWSFYRINSQSLNKKFVQKNIRIGRKSLQFDASKEKHLWMLGQNSKKRYLPFEKSTTTNRKILHHFHNWDFCKNTENTSQSRELLTHWKRKEKRRNGGEKNIGKKWFELARNVPYVNVSYERGLYAEWTNVR